MLIRIGYDIALRLPAPTTLVYVLHVHPSRKGDLVKAENFRTEPGLPIEEYVDDFGNHCGRINAPTGVIRFLNEAVVRDPGELDRYVPGRASARCSGFAGRNALVPIAEPLLRSRQRIAGFRLANLWWNAPWMAACSSYLRFRPQPSPLQLSAGSRQSHRSGSLSRKGWRLPRFYASRNDIMPVHEYTCALRDRVSRRYWRPSRLEPMDFSAWFEVYLGSHWHTFDARHNRAPDRAGPDRSGPRRRRRSHHDGVRSKSSRAFQGYYRRGARRLAKSVSCRSSSVP